MNTFTLTKDNLTNAIFDNSALDAKGSGSKSEARAMAQIMLTALDSVYRDDVTKYSALLRLVTYVIENDGGRLDRSRLQNLAEFAQAELVGLRALSSRLAKVVELLDSAAMIYVATPSIGLGRLEYAHDQARQLLTPRE